ncbi:BspA family leucine-rich repeat surface protein [Psychrobacter sp. T6-6]|uniref:BspA family leucine-rich repeat surface protein n=1 Tax=Psychrobacter sp. T6-6 TaxID=3457452 RepID=UPI003FD43B1E
MIESKTLGSAAGIQYQGVIDKTETSSLPSLANGVVTGKFKRGRMDKPFKVTPSTYQALLGRDPSNPSYLAVEDAFKRGISQLSVLRTGSSASGAAKPAIPVNTGTVIFSVESYENSSSEYPVYIYIEDPVGDWSLTESGEVIADSTGFTANGIEVDIYDGGVDMYLKIAATEVKNFELDATAVYVDISYDGNHTETTSDPLAKVVISQFSSKIPSFTTGLPNTLLTVPEYIPPELIDISYLFFRANLFNQDISMWDVSHVINMNSMLQQAGMFNQDLSNWCTPNLPFGAEYFDKGADAWVLPRPVWGTCPRGENGRTDYVADLPLPSQQPRAPNSYIRVTPVTPVDGLLVGESNNTGEGLWLS